MSEVADTYTVSGAAKSCGRARSTINTAIERGEIGVERTIDGAPLIAKAELERWLAGHAERQKRGGRPKKTE
jgi:hypothetical protein